MKKQLMLGNEAVARGLYEAGCRLVSSYPGTPSTEITEYAAEYCGDCPDLYCEWAPNEKVALEVAFGASLAGARAACAMKHVGLVGQKGMEIYTLQSFGEGSPTMLFSVSAILVASAAFLGITR